MKLELVDVNAAAKEIDVTAAFLRQLAREGKIPSYRLSRRTLRFDLHELRDWMKRNAEQHHVRAAS